MSLYIGLSIYNASFLTQFEEGTYTDESTGYWFVKDGLLTVLSETGTQANGFEVTANTFSIMEAESDTVIIFSRVR